MDSRRLRGILVHGVVWPVATVLAVVGLAVVVGYNVGLAVLLLSMASAAGLAGLFLSQTRAMRPDTDVGGGETGRDERTAVGLRSALTEDPEAVTGGRQVAITRYAGGLFVISATLVLYLGGLFG